MSVIEADTKLNQPFDRTADHALPLASRAIDFLSASTRNMLEQPGAKPADSSIWLPDSRLMQSCWRELAENGAAEEALSVALLQERQNPLASIQALHSISIVAQREAELRPIVAGELGAMYSKLFEDWIVSDATRQTERLLLAAASAINIGNEPRALSYLERLDQIDRAWDRVLLRSESRTVLAKIVSQIGLHPLISYLIATSIRRHEEVGAQFLHEIVAHLKPKDNDEKLPRRSARLLRKCVQTFQFAPLTSLNSRRLAALVFGQACMIESVLAQLSTMANVQEARRESGIGSSVTNPQLLRQVTRPNANPDVDFQAHTLQQAISVMPVRTISRDDRVQLANRIAELAVQSDGWTAAGSTATLVRLGALKYAVDVVNFIAPTDPTRSEGVISLVRALLESGEDEQAQAQVEKTLVWLSESAGQNSLRATIWGLAEAYLDHGKPEMALFLLDQRQEHPSFSSRIRRWMRPYWTDDMLRDNRIRFRALLASANDWTSQIQELYDELLKWAPVLLDGEALTGFYLDGLLSPLLAGGLRQPAMALLPALADAISHSTSDKHVAHVRKASAMLRPMIEQSRGETAADSEDGTSTVASVGRFLETIWAADASKGLWQTVYGVEGSMPLLYALEGPAALTAIAESAANEGSLWMQE